jgi:hypothetical protein
MPDATAAPMNGMNGTHAPAGDPGKIVEMLAEPMTEGYKPSLPIWALYITDALPQIWLLRDIELMLIHPIVSNALEYFKSGISGAEFWGGPNPDSAQDPKGLPICIENPDVDRFIREQCQLYWDRGVPHLQSGYEYGWQGCECIYKNDDILKWDGLREFSPRDTFILTQDEHPVGVRVKGIRGVRSKGVVDLWMGSEDIPAKGLWYAHNPRWQQHYGRSQLMAAWRPWRRLAWKDAAETVTDMGVYRFAFTGPIIGYPEEEYQTAQQGVPGTTLDSQGRPRRWARDMARQMAEWMKAGAGFGLPTTQYPTEMGGGPKWTAEFPKQVLSVEGLIAYIQYLCDEIYYGVHIPPEVIKASETGSGYSGRSIPIESFLAVQQRIADQLLHLFAEQVLKPLVRWNWGPGIKWNVMVKPLLISKRAMQAGPEGGMEQRNMPQQDATTMPGTEQGMPGMHAQPGQAQAGLPVETGGRFSLDYMGFIEKMRLVATRIHQREVA